MRTVSRRARHALGLLVLVVAVALTATIRIERTLHDPNFDRSSADGLLRSDPALLFYITERIVESGGRPPDDFRADRRIQHPDAIDVPKMFTVGQEFLVAWSYLTFGRGMPLHVFCVFIMSVVASLTLVGAYGLAWELTEKVRWAALAAPVYLFLPANYRTLGLILMREDVSFPCFALHLWLLARAARLRTAWSFAWAALAAVLAVATWHAMSFVLALEMLALLLWFLRTGRNLFAIPRSWIVPAALAVAGAAIPVLRGKVFPLSPAMLMALALLAGARVARRGAAGRARATVLGTLIVLVPVSFGIAWLSGGGQEDYSHVFNLILAKIVHLGVMPDDPSRLSFEARLLWQGPFLTAEWSDFITEVGAGLVVLLAGLGACFIVWRRNAHGDRLFLIATFTVICLVAAYMVERLMILIGFLVPVLGAVLAARLPKPRWGAAVLGWLAVVQAAAFCAWLGHHTIAWYVNPAYNAEIAGLVRWSRQNLPADEAVASDFVHSTILLAHNRNPIVCQPKYEMVESRRRFREYLEAYLKGAPQDLMRFARRYRCRYVLIDRIGMWYVNRYIAGIPLSQQTPAPGTAAAVFGSDDETVLTGVPGFTLVYRSPPGLGLDVFRLYRIEESPATP